MNYDVSSDAKDDVPDANDGLTTSSDGQDDVSDANDDVMTTPGHDKRRQYLSVDEVATLMNVSTKTVYYWCSSGYLPRVKFGRLVRINKAELMSRIDELRKMSCQKRQ